MIYLKTFENYKILESKYTDDDIINCIEKNGYILVKKLKNNSKHKSDTPVYPQNVYKNEVEVSIDGNIEYANMDDIIEISYEPLNTDLDI
jgi:hypothetical protein